MTKPFILIERTNGAPWRVAVYRCSPAGITRLTPPSTTASTWLTAWLKAHWYAKATHGRRHQ